MRLLPHARNVHQKEFVAWRQTGVAFRPRADAPYDVTNATLISARQSKGGAAVAGYWGDIVTGPLVSYGIESEHAVLLEKRNEAYVRTSAQVSEHNVTAMLFELAHARPYPPPSADGLPAVEALTLDGQEERYPPCTITLLTSSSLPGLLKREALRGRVQVAYFSNSMVHLMAADVAPVLSARARLCVESALFLLELKDETRKEFVRKVAGMAGSLGATPPAALQDGDAHLVFERRA